MKITLSLVLVLLIQASTFAEIVTLKSGKVIEGKILENNDQYKRLGVVLL